MRSLLHISDLHFGAEDALALRAVERIAAAQRIDALIVSGDLTQRGRPQEFAAAAAWLGRFEAPVVITPGNHDTSFLNLYNRAVRPFARYARHTAGIAADRLLLPDLCIAAVNTARGMQWRGNWALGAVNARQLEVLADVFAAAAPGAVRAVVCHHPLIGPPDSPLRGSTRGGEEAAAVLSKMGVDLVLSGHLHMPFALPLPAGDGRTWSIGAGTLSERTRGWDASCTLLHITPAGAASEAVLIGPEGGVAHSAKRELVFRPRGTPSKPQR